MTYLPQLPGLLSSVDPKRRFSTFYADHTCCSGLFFVDISRLTKHYEALFDLGFLCFSMSTRSVFPNEFCIRNFALRRRRMLSRMFLCLPGNANCNCRGAPIATPWTCTRIRVSFLFLQCELVWTWSSILSRSRTYSRSTLTAKCDHGPQTAHENSGKLQSKPRWRASTKPKYVLSSFADS